MKKSGWVEQGGYRLHITDMSVFNSYLFVCLMIPYYDIITYYIEREEKIQQFTKLVLYVFISQRIWDRGENIAAK